MSILYLLIPLGLVLLGIAVWAFFWAVGSGQFDDLKSPGWSVVMDDDKTPGHSGSERARNESGHDSSHDSSHESRHESSP
ncbi:MAG TPA: cbb3-type cytochrome oxidase assembly protein CcoS [Woeseiaceae bacterium]